MIQPKVSVNIPCFNSSRFLKETIESVLAQTMSEFEIIFVDDGSTDNTKEIINSFKDERIKYFYQQNKGLPWARNKALAESRGKYIAFLDHDDIWLPDKLQRQTDLLDLRPDAVLAYSNYFWLFPNGSKRLVLHDDEPQGEIFERLLYNYPVGLLTAMVRKSAVDKLGLTFDENLHLCEDFDFFMRLIYGANAVYINKPLAMYRIHNNMQSIKSGDKYPDEFGYAIEKLQNIYPVIGSKYHAAIEHMNATIGFMRAKLAVMRGEPASARTYLKNCKWHGLKFLILYMAACLPHFVLRAILNVRSKYFLKMHI